MAAPISLQQATATFSQSGFPVGAALDGNVSGTGWAIDPNEVAQTAVFETNPTDLDYAISAGGFDLSFKLEQLFGNTHTIGRFRLSATSDDRATFADGLATGGDVTAGWTVLVPTTFNSANGATMTLLGDNSILLSGTSPSTDTYDVTATTSLTEITGIRLEVLEDPSLPGSGPGRQPLNANFVLTNLTFDATPVSTPVPEPTTLTLLGLGLGMAFVLRRCRRRK